MYRTHIYISILKNKYFERSSKNALFELKIQPQLRLNFEAEFLNSALKKSAPYSAEFYQH